MGLTELETLNEIKALLEDLLRLELNDRGSADIASAKIKTPKI